MEKDSRKLLLKKYKAIEKVEEKFRFKFLSVKRRRLDKEYQKYLLNNWDIYKYYLSFSTNTFLHGIYYCKSGNIIQDSLVLNARRIWNNYRSKQRYYMKYTRKLFEIQNNNLYFVTFTFNDEYIHDLSREDIYKLIQKKIDYYIINEDYGDKGRRHYHCICILYTSFKLSCNFIRSFWLYGNVDLKKVDCSSNLSAKILNLYLIKLNQHSLKNKTKEVKSSLKLKELLKK